MLKREKCGFGGRSGRELRRGIINPSGKWRESSCYCSKKPSIFGEKLVEHELACLVCLEEKYLSGMVEDHLQGQQPDW